LKKAEIQKFLSTHIPFSFLKEEEIKILTQNVSLKKFKKGETVFRVEDPPVKWLYILYEGFIVLTINSHVLEYVIPGEAFGVASAISGKPVRANALVEEDSVCILVPCEDFRRVFNLNRDFSSFYINLFEKRLTSLYRLYGGELIKLPEKYLIVSKVGDILTRKPVLCTLDTSIQDAVRLMRKEEVGSIIVVDKEKKPLGIITAKDLRKIIAENISSTEPISTVMSSPVICINENSSIHDAYLLLISKTINHLVVVSNTTHIRGVITAKDLLLAMEPTYSLTILSKRIVKANSVDELKKLYEQTIKAIIFLLNRGAGFYEISELLTEINDMFTRKIIEFAEKKLEEEGLWKPIRYVWITAGSGGRREQTFRIDQDNAIIYDDTEKNEKVIEELALTVNDFLEKLGVPKCKAGYMASNPMWRKSLEEWKKYFDSWINQPEGENLLNLALFLDLRPVYGDEKLAKNLRSYVIEKSGATAARALAETITMVATPMTFLGRIKYGKRGIDVKTQGLLPIVNGVKALAFEAKIPVTNTLERINSLIKRGVLSEETGNELKEAYQFLSILRLKHQLNQYLAKEEPDNYIKPEELTELEEKILKECFRIIADHKKFLSGKYFLTYYP